MDDIVITGDDAKEILDLKKKLSCEFEMKDPGNLKYFLGIVTTKQPSVFQRTQFNMIALNMWKLNGTSSKKNLRKVLLVFRLFNQKISLPIYSLRSCRPKCLMMLYAS